MALQPHLRFTSLGEGPNTVEFWLDLLCPFSASCSNNIASFLVPAVLPGGKYHGKIRLLVRPYPQPWHPQGGYLAEVVLAFGKVFASDDSQLWFAYFNELMRSQSQFLDPAVRALTADQIKDRAYTVAGDVLTREKGWDGPKAGAQLAEAMTMKEGKFGG
jgi:hypothetical protein